MGYQAQQANPVEPVTASMDRRRRFAELAYTTFAMGLLLPFGLVGQSAPNADYWVYVANESSDMVSLIRFGAAGLVEEKTITVGLHPADLDGAHGVSVSPDGVHWYVSLAHGTPYGKIWKFETGSDRFVDSTTVGLFPATMGIVPDASILFIVNFNLHGDPMPSSVSAVFTPSMNEMTKIETCVMPHGSRLSADGLRHYSTCMMSDQLVEIATDRLAVNRRFALTKGHERLLPLDESDSRVVGPNVCKPTWVVLSADDNHLYIPCNGRRQVLEIDRSTLTISRVFDTGAGPYNADVSPDGRYLVVSLKGDQAVAVIELSSAAQTRIETTQPVTHGVVITPDSRYAFISNEAVGAIRGTVDVIDLVSQTRVASVEVQYQPGGIAFWKMEPAADSQ